MASLSLVQGRAEVGGSRIEAAPMALRNDKPPRPDLSERLSPEDVRLLAINALGLEIRVKAPPRRRTTIDALVMEPMGRNVQRPSRDAAPVTQRPSFGEIVAEFMKVSDVATNEPAGMDWLQNKKARVDEPNDAGGSPSKRGPLAPPPGESHSKKAHAEPPEEPDDESDLNLEDADPVPLLWRAMTDGMDDPEVRAAYER